MDSLWKVIDVVYVSLAYSIQTQHIESLVHLHTKLLSSLPFIIIATCLSPYLYLAAPGYMITLNVVIQSDNQIFVVWTTPPSVQNQGLVYFDVTVQGLSPANQYYREQRQYYIRGQTNSSALTFNGLGKVYFTQSHFFQKKVSGTLTLCKFYAWSILCVCVCVCVCVLCVSSV